ncbi:MAG: biotin/lipoyl-binding protein [Bacteroidaceae bacterium]|nr:biotin/lipoyl-binding protein [Bacteroidaceae bacterium]
MQDFKFKIDGAEYTANVEEKEDGKLQVTVNGKAYEVEVPGHVAAAPKVQPPVKPAAAAAPVAAPVAAPAAAPAAPKKASGAGTAITAPLPGVITSIEVKEGDQVKAGQTVIVMEAMKMANNITAESDGTVKAILVQQGAQVQSGDALIEIG